MKTLFPTLNVDLILRKSDEFEDLSFEIVGLVLKNHGFEEEYHRLQDLRYIGVGKHRILSRLCLEYMDGSWINTIRFYESCNRIDDEPHYEDLTTTLLIAFASSFLAAIAVELGKVAVNRIGKTKLFKKNNETKKNVINIFYAPVQYVLLGTILREIKRNSEIDPDWQFYLSKEEFNARLDELRNNFNAISRNNTKELTFNIKATEKFWNFYCQYLVKRKLSIEDPVNDILSDVLKKIEEKIECNEGRK